MRPIGLLLCVAACTLNNPAFLVTDTEVGSASGDTNTDPTPPTSTTNAPTSASSDPNPTGSTTESPATTDPATTTANVSDSDVTTDPSVTSTTTTDATTTTTEPQPMTAATSDSSGVDTEPLPCGFVDFMGPQLPLHVLPEDVQPTTGQCLGWQMKDYVGKLEATPGGFKVYQHPECPSIDLPDDGFAFQVSLPGTPVGNDQCVKLRFSVHADAKQCTVSSFAVTHQGNPVLVGSFGRSEFGPEVPFQLGFQPTGTCGACDDCCAPAPNPDAYTFELPDHSVPEGQKLELEVNGKTHLFYNLRSHIHGPDCQNEELATSDWQHFDWVAIRLE